MNLGFPMIFKIRRKRDRSQKKNRTWDAHIGIWENCTQHLIAAKVRIDHSKLLWLWLVVRCRPSECWRLADNEMWTARMRCASDRPVASPKYLYFPCGGFCPPTARHLWPWPPSDKGQTEFTQLLLQLLLLAAAASWLAWSTAKGEIQTQWVRSHSLTKGKEKYNKFGII